GVVSAICESLLEHEVLPLDMPLFREASPEDIEMGAPRTGATDLQPTDARCSSSLLRLRQGRRGKQAHAESKNRQSDPHTRSIHRHGMAQSPSSSWRNASLSRSSDAAPLKRMAPFSST